MAGRLLCVNPRCRMLGRHRGEHPAGEDCRGCLPRYAGDGRNLCEVCTRRLAEDAATAAELYAELEQVLARPGAQSERTTGTPNHGTELNDRAVAARTLIRHTLVSWCLMVAEERGITTPEDTLPALAAYIGRHAVWLSAHPAAGDCADELADLAHGAPWRTAYPSGARRYPVGPCLVDGCGGEIVAVLRDTDQLLPSALTCDADPEHTWTAAAWREIGRALHPHGMSGRYVTAAEAARDWRLPLGTVHRLAHTEAWRRSEDGRRPVLYLATDVDATMKRRSMTARRDLTSDLR